MSVPTPAPETHVDVLDEVRARLDGLDDRPLHEHPEQFAAIDRLLRAALDGSGSDATNGAGSDRPGSR
jgi:hypothetical protein